MNAPTAEKARLYYPKMPVTWWLRNLRYFLFMMRELSSVFIAIFLVVFLVQIAALARGPEAYTTFMRKLESPGWIIFHVVALLFSLYHSYTWFDLTSKVQVVRLGGDRYRRRGHRCEHRRVARPLLSDTVIVSLCVAPGLGGRGLKQTNTQTELSRDCAKNQ